MLVKPGEHIINSISLLTIGSFFVLVAAKDDKPKIFGWDRPIPQNR